MKRSRPRTLPLGIDIGKERVRVALCERVDDRTRLLAVAARAVSGDAVRAVRDGVEELATAERRCVLGIAAPEAILNEIQFPAMSRLERLRAARFEAARFVDYPLERAIVSIAPIDGRERWRIGIARRDAMAERLAIARAAGLRPLAVDDAAFALWRAQPRARSVVDVGADATLAIVFCRPVPIVARIPIGGDALTEGIARSLGIDALAAEQRKHTIGFAGAGEAQRDGLIAAVAEHFGRARSSMHVEVEPVVTTGNGSRVPLFAEALERATGYSVRPAEIDPVDADGFPPDVLRAATADWALAYGLSLWEAAA